jgi:hypothetical protein
MTALNIKVELFPVYEESEPAEPECNLLGQKAFAGIEIRCNGKTAWMPDELIEELGLDTELWGAIFTRQAESKKVVTKKQLREAV